MTLASDDFQTLSDQLPHARCASRQPLGKPVVVNPLHQFIGKYAMDERVALMVYGRRGSDANDCFLHWLYVLTSVTGLVNSLEIGEVIRSTARPRHDVVNLRFGGAERFVTQRTDTASLFQEPREQLVNVGHASILSRANLLKDVDDLSVERTVLALREAGQPVVQFGVQPNHQSYERSHGFSVHHADNLRCVMASLYTMEHRNGVPSTYPLQENVPAEGLPSARGVSAVNRH